MNSKSNLNDLLSKNPILPKEAFAWNKYCGRLGIRSDKVLDVGTAKILPGYQILGWRDAGDIQLRPRTGQYAFMGFEESTGDEFWFHFDPECMNEN